MDKWSFYTAKELKPDGWIKRQLEIQAAGLSGNLDKMWKDVKDSRWIGGSAEGWERVPYWLDGFVPLAYLLKNEDMIARAKRYIDAIIAGQREDGWLCPCDEEKISQYDTWALQLMSKVLVVYYECSDDERIPKVLYRALKNYHELLCTGKIELFCWAKYRWFETFIAINFLQKRYREPWIADLARILKEQGIDYSESIDRWKRPLNQAPLETHIVNLTMMLKSEAISCDILEQEYTNMAERLSTVLREYNGTPVGLFTGDEALSGLSPIQGTELCSVAEQMYSYEWLFAHTGDSKWAERLEMLAFNALPAAISDDMWTHQYDQMSNQIACQRFNGKPIFRTNLGEAHLFGLEPNYGCCTANFNQAWPKFALSAFLHSGNTVISAVPIPSVLKTEKLSVTLKTEYPFENRFEYTIEATERITFKIRIPSFAECVTVNGICAQECKELTFEIEAGQKMQLEVSYLTRPQMFDRPYNLKSVRCGSLVFSVPISYEKKMYEYEKNHVERKFPYCDYEYIPTSDWNYAYSSFDLERIKNEISEIPFSSEKPPVTVKAKVKKIAWGFEDGYETVCAKIPESRVPLGNEEEIELYPYGCAKLRMTEIPLI
ncbi:MAG: glycoside hydrolase family 127 protein [Clostridia bacterium]|nr:glycoside hydrolase family 127 protein [Clostridia bacterium]